MAGQQTIAGEVVVSYMKKHPKVPKLTLAKLLHRDHPKLFPSIENARTMVRKYSGSLGVNSKTSPEKYGTHRPKGVPGEDAWQDMMPEARDEELLPWHLPKSERKVLVMSDVHLPFHCEVSLTIAIEHGLSEKPDSILLNGDVMDMAAASFHEKDPRERDLAGELESTRQFLKMLRAAFPNIPIRYRGSNHEARLERYLMKYADILLGMPEFHLKTLLRLGEIGIEYIEPQTPMYLGKLTVIHGDEYKGGGGINPARWLALRAGESSLIGHFHRTSTHIDRTIRGETRGWWSTGCLCTTSPKWLRQNQWNKGFAMVNVNSDGSFEVENLMIIDGKVR